MITAAINILIYSILMLVIGLYKPKWALFWMKSPDRVMVVIFSAVLFMIAATLFGEGNGLKEEEINQPTDTIEVPSSQKTTIENLTDDQISKPVNQGSKKNQTGSNLKYNNLYFIHSYFT